MSLEFWFIISLFTFCGVIIWITERGRKERQELYNRLMARDLSDYRQMADKPKPPRENFLIKQMKQGYGFPDDDE